MSARTTLQWDPDDSQTEKAAIALRYQPTETAVINVAYRFRRALTDIEQTDVSLRWPVTDRWSVVGRWNYSLQNESTLEAVGGVEYRSCCWGMRLVGRRFLRNTEGKFDTGVFLSGGIPPTLARPEASSASYASSRALSAPSLRLA